MKKRIILYILIPLLILAGLVLMGPLRQRLQRPLPPLPDEVLTPVQRGTITRVITGTGTLKPGDEISLAFTLTGQVNAVHVQEGDRVEKGDPLLDLDDTQQQLGYIRAKNAYQAALVQGSSAQIQEQELNLAVAEKNLAATVLTAPFSGLISEVSVNEGDYISPGQPVAHLMDDSTYKVNLLVDEADARHIFLGQEANIFLDALPGNSYKGSIQRISLRTQISGGVVTVPVDIVLESISQNFKPGFTAEIELIVDRAENALILPITATYIEDGQEYAVIYAGEELAPVPIETGLSDGVHVVVLKGLEEGDTVLLNTYLYAGYEAENPFMLRGRPF